MHGSTDRLQHSVHGALRSVTIDLLSQWHRLVAVGQMGLGETAETFAATHTHKLLEAIKKNDRVHELAINPLMLTVIALIDRDRVKRPHRLAELYQEAVALLLCKWEEARRLRA